METNSSGGVVGQMGHFPFGESWYNGPGTKWFFTTYERDAESGNDYAMARYHVSRLGRLASPDPIAGSTANPQSLNRYSYSVNDPANVTDPSGALIGCPNTVEMKPSSKSQQASGDGPSDADNSDVSTGSSDLDADPPPQSGCGSRVNPFGGSGDAGSDWEAAFGPGFDGGFVGDDSGMIPSGTFQPGQSTPGGISLASEVGLMNAQIWGITDYDNVVCWMGRCNELPDYGWISTPYLNLLTPQMPGANPNFSGNLPSALQPKPLQLRNPLAHCVLSLFGVSFLSYSPSGPGANGSFSGSYQGKTFTVYNNATIYGVADLTAYVRTHGYPGATTEGLTFRDNPYVNFSAYNGPDSVADIQTFELGNSLGYITNLMPANPNQNPGPGNTEPGTSLLNCVSGKGNK